MSNYGNINKRWKAQQKKLGGGLSEEAYGNKAVVMRLKVADRDNGAE